MQLGNVKNVFSTFFCGRFHFWHPAPPPCYGGFTVEPWPVGMLSGFLSAFTADPAKKVFYCSGGCHICQAASHGLR
jgi:hypothetical protein